MFLKRNAAVLLVAGLVVGGGAVAYAAGSPDRPSLSANAHAGAGSNENAGGNAGDRPRLLRRAVHGDLIVRSGKGQFTNVALDRGILESKTDTSLTLKRPDGVTVTVTVDSKTRFRGVSGIGDLKTGKRVGVVSKDGKALLVHQPDRDQQPGQQQNGPSEAD